MALTLIASMLLSACGTAASPAASSAPAPTTRKTDPASADTLVLRWRLTGGIAGIGGNGTPPDFSLYGDGRAIAPEKGTPGSLREYRLKSGVVRRLTDDARAAGLDNPRRLNAPGGVVDALTLEITFGSAQTFIMYPEARDDPAVRLWKRLDPTRWAAGEQAAPARPYVPERMAVLAEPAPPGGNGGRATPWPLTPLDRGVERPAGRCVIVSGRDATAATRLSRTATPQTRWRSGDKVHLAQFRPLLPDEHTCEDITPPSPTS
jgi:hypothetical protein